MFIYITLGILWLASLRLAFHFGYTQGIITGYQKAINLMIAMKDL